MTLTKLQPARSGEPRYLYRAHVVRRCTRDWDARGMGGNGWSGPKVTWEFRRHGSGQPWEGGYRTRADAMAEIDLIQS